MSTVAAATFLASKLLGHEEVAEGTWAFHLEKPPGFTFKPGQAIDLVLPGAGGADARHAFSLVSAPAQPELVVATRMRDSSYKRALAGLPAGAAVGIDGPFGSLTLHKDRTRAALFIAGGIGITPFMSILRHALPGQEARQLVLLYSNRRPEHAAYLAELEGMAKAHPNFRLVATMTEAGGSPWQGETRLVDAQLVQSASAGLERPIYYLVGPPGMVGGVRKLLEAAGFDDDDVRTEEFFGY
jgi:ferredoxin-NADP reductase